MTRRPMKRLLALRAMEEERAEAEVNRQRRIRQACMNALQASEERSAAALRALYAALHDGDRAGAISAEMELAFGPLERSNLRRQITHLNPFVEAATSAWRNARMCRMQIEALADAAETVLRRKTELRDQKALDAWFLACRHYQNADVSFQRKEVAVARIDGPARARSDSE